jgi:hypothetical protein
MLGFTEPDTMFCVQNGWNSFKLKETERLTLSILRVIILQALTGGVYANAEDAIDL